MAGEIADFGRVPLGADKASDRKQFVRELLDHNVTPHIAQKQRSATDQQTSHHGGYAISQTKRKRVEKILGWLKTVRGLRQSRPLGVEQGLDIHPGADRPQFWCSCGQKRNRGTSRRIVSNTSNTLLNTDSTVTSRCH